MAEIASQGRVGPQGGGEATVLDTSKFYDQMYTVQKGILADQEKKRKEYAQQQATWNGLLEDMPDVWQSDNEYVTQAVDEYNDFIIDLKSQGLDPEIMDTTLMKKMKGLENNVRKATSAAKDNEAYYNQAFNILNQDKQSKYNKDYATQWLKDYADSSKSPQDRYKLRNESNPFKLNYDLIEFIDETIPDAEVVDNGRNKITSRNKEAHRGLVLDYIMNDEKGKEIYDSLKKPGETVDMFSERISQQGQLKYPPKQDTQPAPARSGGGGGGGGGGAGKKEEKKPNITYGKDSGADWDSSLTSNKVMLQEKPKVGVVSIGGNPVKDFVPAYGFYIKPGGTVTAKGYGIDENGSQVDVDVDYNTNMQSFNTEGYPDIFDLFRNPTSAGGAAGSTTTNYTGIPTGGF
jgi:hypothetical protein